MNLPVYGKHLGTVEVRGWAPPGLNGSGGLIRMHWTAYKRKRSELINRMAGTSVPVISQPVHAVYTRFGMRPMDRDNLGATAKIPFDVLREVGVLEDDNPACVRTVLNEEEIVRKKEDQGFRVEFYSIGGGN